MPQKTGLPEHPQRRQFSLRALFSITLLVALGCSLFMVATWRHRADVAGQAAVESVGGTVEEIMTQFWQEDKYLVDLRATAITDAQLARLAPKLKRMTYVDTLFVDSPNVTAAVLPHLRGFSRLSVLSMSGTQIPSEEVEAFCSEEGILCCGTVTSGDN